MPEQEEKNRRLLQGQTVIYPFTKQELVIGLQKTIMDKLPIKSNVQPELNFVAKQIWLDTGENADFQEIEAAPRIQTVSNYVVPDVSLEFGRPSNEANLEFGGNAGAEIVENNTATNDNNLSFGNPRNESIEFGTPNESGLTFGG